MDGGHLPGECATVEAGFPADNREAYRMPASLEQENSARISSRRDDPESPCTGQSSGQGGTLKRVSSSALVAPHHLLKSAHRKGLACLPKIDR